jgi:hypothetical protein
MMAGLGLVLKFRFEDILVCFFLLCLSEVFLLTHPH